MAYSQQRLEAAAREFCLMLNEAQRHGYEIRVDMDWNPGLTASFRTTKCWHARLIINGVELTIDPDKT